MLSPAALSRSSRPARASMLSTTPTANQAAWPRAAVGLEADCPRASTLSPSTGKTQGMRFRMSPPKKARPMARARCKEVPLPPMGLGVFARICSVACGARPWVSAQPRPCAWPLGRQTTSSGADAPRSASTRLAESAKGMSSRQPLAVAETTWAAAGTIRPSLRGNKKPSRACAEPKPQTTK